MMKAMLVTLTWFGIVLFKVVSADVCDCSSLDKELFDPEVRRGTLSNGLTYYIKTNTEPPERIQLRLAVRVGSVLEEESQRGLAHYLEHMAFNGTASFAGNEIISYLESVGADLGPDVNAYTSFDETVYKLQIPTDEKVVAQGFDILSEWAYAITLDPEEVEKERGVIIEEWRLRSGARQRILDKQLPILLGDSQYSERMPIGLLEIIKTASAEDLRGFYERWYRPELMAVIAVGDFDPDEMEALIREHFASPPEGLADYPRAYPSNSPTDLPEFEIPVHDDLKVGLATDPEMNLTELGIYYKLPAYPEQDCIAYREYLVNALFASMLNDRLAERGREANPPYIAAGVGKYILAGDTPMMYSAAYLDKDKISSGMDALLEEMSRVVQYGFTETELERAKAEMLQKMKSTWHEKDQQQSGRLVNEYLDHFLDNEVVPGLDAEYTLHQEMLPLISLEEVNEVADPWIGVQNAAVLLSGPDGIPVGDEVKAELLAKVSAISSLDVTPYDDKVSDAPLMANIPDPGSIVSEDRIEAADAVRWQLSNGITVIAKQTDFKNDEVLLYATSPGGSSLVGDADYISALAADSLVLGSGVGEHDKVALDKLLAGNTASLSPYISESFEGFSGKSSPEHLETLFQLVALYATAPRFDQDYYDSFLSNLKSRVENRHSQPDAVFSDTYRSVMGQNHFRTKPLTLEFLEDLDFDRSRAIYNDRFSDLGDFTFIIVGAFDWEVLRDLSSTYLATLPTTGRSETWQDVGIDPPPSREEHFVRKGIDQRSITRVAFAGEVEEWNEQLELKFEVMATMLNIYLQERIREELGGTYAIFASSSGHSIPDEEFKLEIAFSSDPAKAYELFGEVLSGVVWMQNGAEQVYLDKAKEIIRSDREEQLRRNNFWLNGITHSVRVGEAFEENEEFEKRLENLTLDEITGTALKYLHCDRYVRVVLLPKEEE